MKAGLFTMMRTMFVVGIARSLSTGPIRSVGTFKNLILFDGVCNFCNGWVDTVLRLDPKGKFKFTALQSPTGQQVLEKLGKQPDDLSSVVYVRLLDDEKQEAFFKSDAALKVAEDLGIPSFLVSTVQAGLPLSLRNSAYDMVAENRYNLLGKRDVCRLETSRQYADRFI